MIQKIKVGPLDCLCSRGSDSRRIVYILYPVDLSALWVESAVRKYDVTVVVITGLDWQNVLSPWPAPGVPKGSEAFRGEAAAFLRTLQGNVIPNVEQAMGIGGDIVRTLVGVSMSGLFTLWQWMLCDTFTDIASLSGSFWYEGFLDWMKERPVPHKAGKAFFLLGDKERRSRVKAFRSVQADTEQIVRILDESGICTTFTMVPGDHYSDPVARLDKALQALFDENPA